MHQKLLEFIGRRLRPVEIAILTKWALRIQRKIIRVENNYFYIDPVSDFGLKLQTEGCYEPVMTGLIKNILIENDVFIDVGANEGFFSIVASAIVGPKGKILCVEPQQRLWEVIIKNFEINNYFNFQLIPFAISDKSGSVTMNLYPSTNTGASSLSKDFNFKTKFTALRKKIWGSLTIKVTTLADVIEKCNLSKIKLIKVDVEGFEYLVIRGSEAILAKGIIENFIIEIHPMAMESLGHSSNHISGMLKKYGYKEKIISDNLLLFTLCEARA